MAMKEMVAPTGLNAPPEAEKRTLNSDCKFRVVRKRMKWLKVARYRWGVKMG